MQRASLLATGTIVLALLGAAPAVAGPLEDFQNDGAVDPCSYSEDDLRRAERGLPPDVRQYSPGLVDQLNAGREGCGGAAPGAGPDPRQLEAVPGVGGAGGGGGGAGSSAAGAAGRAGAGAGRTRVPDPPAPDPRARQRLASIATPSVSADTRSDVPAWATVALVLLLLGGLLLAAVRFTGVGLERVTEPLRASFAEVGGRTADSAATLWDRVRLGR